MKAFHMVNRYYTTTFAQAYGENAYGDCSYNDTTSCTTSGGGSTGTDTGSGSGGVLTNTGFMVAAIVTIAAVLMLIALVVRIARRKPAQQQAVAETEVSDNDERLQR